MVWYAVHAVLCNRNCFVEQGYDTKENTEVSFSNVFFFFHLPLLIGVLGFRKAASGISLLAF